MKKLFEKYRARLAREGMLKALIFGIIFGFAATFVFALVTSFYTDWWEYWYLAALGVGLVVGLVAGIILYFVAFRPDTKTVARRIDSLGLEERLITMTELENDDSYIAKRQREDAKAHLSKFDAKSIKVAIAKSLIVAAVITSVFGISMTTVNALAQHEIIPTLPEMILPVDPTENMVMVIYEVNDELGGWIEGETDQLIDIGGSTTTVVAVAEDGYMFMHWEDEEGNVVSANPERYETNVISDMTFTAVFAAFETDDDENGDLDTDEPSDRPDEKDPTIPDNSDNPPTDKGDDNKYNKNNMIHDGETPYQDVFDEYYQEVMEDIRSGKFTEEEADIVDNFFDILGAGVSEK